MAVQFHWDRGALDDLARSEMVEAVLDQYGRHVRTRARTLARPVSRRLADAIEAELDDDADGLYVDVGYDKKKPGFVLWWHEVGTSKFAATPHLRPALRGQ